MLRNHIRKADRRAIVSVLYIHYPQRLGQCWVSVEQNVLLCAWGNMVMSSSCPWLSSGDTHKNILISTLSPCQRPDLAKPDSDWPKKLEKPHSYLQTFLWLPFSLLAFILFWVLLTYSCYQLGWPRSYLILLEESQSMCFNSKGFCLFVLSFKWLKHY